MTEDDDEICKLCGHDHSEPEPPTVDDIALAAMQALLASGKFEGSPAAAVALAWQVCVPAYFEQRNGFSEFMEKLHGR